MQAHADWFVVQQFVKHVQREKDAALRTVLTRLCQLHALYRIHVNSGEFVKVLTVPCLKKVFTS